jgi:hypothetical protein
MAILIVSYDLNMRDEKRENLLTYIRAYSWVQLSESVYAINTHHTPQSFLNGLIESKLLDKNDDCTVFQTVNPPAMSGPRANDITKWYWANSR